MLALRITAWCFLAAWALLAAAFAAIAVWAYILEPLLNTYRSRRDEALALYDAHYRDVLAQRRERLAASQEQFRQQFPELSDFHARRARLNQQPIDTLAAPSASDVYQYFYDRNQMVRDAERLRASHRLDPADEALMREQFAATRHGKLAGYVEGDDAWSEHQ